MSVRRAGRVAHICLLLANVGLFWISGSSAILRDSKRVPTLAPPAAPQMWATNQGVQPAGSEEDVFRTRCRTSRLLHFSRPGSHIGNNSLKGIVYDTNCNCEANVLGGILGICGTCDDLQSIANAVIHFCNRLETAQHLGLSLTYRRLPPEDEHESQESSHGAADDMQWASSV